MVPTDTTLALRLAVTAPTDEKADLALGQAEILAARMTEEEVDQAKAAAGKRPPRSGLAPRRPGATRSR
jgi:hypothetical protein